MLAGLRRGVKNPLVLGLLVLLGVAFAFTGFELAGPVGGARGPEVAEVDGDPITAADVTRDAEQRVRQARQQNPRADMAALVAGGAAALPGPSGATALPGPSAPAGLIEDESMLSIANIDGQMRASSIRRIGQLAERHPEETLSIVRGWMSEEPS